MTIDEYYRSIGYGSTGKSKVWSAIIIPILLVICIILILMFYGGGM